MIVALHEVGDAGSASRIQHLLARLRVLSHHLMVRVVLLLLQLVVKCLELAVLGHRAAAEDIVDVLPDLDLGAETVVV